jgi:HK97 family phage prohead protease
MGKSLQPPKGSDQDGLVREFAEARLEVRASQGMKMPTLFGYIIRFDEPTEIDSWEGRFIERIAPGAAKKTLKDNGDAIKILFDHGHDPNIGSKPLAKPQWEEDEEGVRYEGELFDCDYCRELVPGLEAGQYGASFKFRVIKESFDEEPEPSDENPEGLPERTIEELKLYEGGPVVFPAYVGASAGVRSRSGTARIFMERAKQDPTKVPELVELFTEWVRTDPDRVRDLLAEKDGDGEATSETKSSTDEVTETESEEGDAEGHPVNKSNDGAEPAHSDEGRQATTPMPIEFEDREDWFEDESEKEWNLP